MSNFNPNDPTLDARLKALLDTLRDVPPREPQAAERGRAKFIQEMDDLFANEATPHSKRIIGRSPQFPKKKESFIMSIKQRFAFTALTLVILAIAILFGGAGVTAYAAQNALPGDALYPVKTQLEQTRIALTGDPALRTQLYLSFAERRLDEMALLIKEGRVDQVGKVAKEFDLHIQGAIDAFGAASASDPASAESLASQIAEALLRYAQTLNNLLSNAPEEVRPSIQQAIRTSILATGLGLGEGKEVEVVGVVEAITSDSVTINGQTFTITNQTEIKNQIQVGAMVKVHAIAGADGTLRVREMEQVQTQEQHQEQEQHQAGDNQNGNANMNGNDNGDDDNQNGNANMNGNDNGDDDNQNGNANMNGNDNGDDDNQNDNVNMNGNDNGDDNNQNSNANMNGNDNGNDDNQNSNVNMNGNNNGNNDNQNGNVNMNGNDNGDNDNQNGNANMNGNDNGDDDNQNSNANMNGNDNGDDDNQNGNANMNGNDNGNNDNENDNDNDNENENGYIPPILWVL
jgi:hypothetical protein